MDIAVTRRNSDLMASIVEARAVYSVRRPASAALHAKANEVMPGGNTRSVLSYGPFPTAMARGVDCTLWDIDGHQYLDLCGEYTAGLFGHSEPRLHAAIRAALDSGLNLAAVGVAEERLARILCTRFASIERIRFTNSGTEANLMALTAARAFTGRETVMAFRGGYHGSVLTFPISGTNPATLKLPFLLADYNDIAGMLAMIQAHADTLAAVIVEPMMGSAGCIPATQPFLTALRDITRDLGILLCFDEVMTSRMSTGGMQQRTGVTPDMTQLGKYVAGGMSFGAFGGREDIMALFAADLPHAGTFNNNVLSMAAGSVAMGDIFTGDVPDRLYARGEALRETLNQACRDADVPMHFTGLGSMLAPHFRNRPIERPYMQSPAEEGLRELFFFDMLEAGIYIARRGMVALSLPVGDPDLARFVAAVSEFIQIRGPLLRTASAA